MYANPAQWAAGGGWQNHFTNQAGEGKFTVTNVPYMCIPRVCCLDFSSITLKYFFVSVDWAALAKQWIQQKDQTPSEAGVPAEKPQNGHEGIVSGNTFFSFFLMFGGNLKSCC